MIKKQLIIFLTLCISFVWAEDITVEGTGWGASENEATMQAKREALAAGIGQMLISQTEVENFMVKKDQIITQTMGNVKSFKVLSKKKGPDGAWEVKISATVSKDGIAEDLAALMILKDAVGNPRIAILIQETNMDNTDPSANKAETLLIDFFKGKRFEVVDPSYALKFRESKEGASAMAGDPTIAARLGQQLNAEVIIVGKVISKASDVSHMKAFANSSMKSASANISLKAINVSSREIMAAKNIDAPAIHVNQHTAGNKAIEKAVKKLVTPKKNGKATFFDALIESWRKAANDGKVFRITVEGVKNYKLNKAVKKVLSNGIGEQFKARSFKKPRLKADLTFVGSTDDLCEKLDGLKVNGSHSLSVEECQDSQVLLKVTP